MASLHHIGFGAASMTLRSWPSQPFLLSLFFLAAPVSTTTHQPLAAIPHFAAARLSEEAVAVSSEVLENILPVGFTVEF